MSVSKSVGGSDSNSAAVEKAAVATARAARRAAGRPALFKAAVAAFEVLEARQLMSVSAGNLDASFHATGKLTTDFNGGEDTGAGIVVEPSTGDVVVAGTANGMFAVSTYAPDGTPLHTVTTAIGSSSQAVATAAAIDPSGRVVVAGYAAGGATLNDFVVARYTVDANGNVALDASFNGGGFVQTDVAGAKRSDVANAVALQPVAGGYAVVLAGTTGTGPTARDAAARYTMAGALDATFGTAGFVVTTGTADAANAVAVAADGSLLLAGTTASGAEVVSVSTTYAVARHAVPLGAGSVLNAVVVNPANGEYVVAGSADNNFVVAEVTAAGAFDTTFGTGGKTETAFAGDTSVAGAVLLQANNKIVLVGTATDGSGNAVFALSRYSSTGLADAAFGTGGSTTTTFNAAAGTSVATDGTVEPDGKIIAAGYTDAGAAPDDFAVARFVADNAPTATGSTTLTTIVQNQTTAPGNTVASILAGLGAADADGDPLGLAVTGVDDSHGQFQYSTDGGATFAALPATAGDTAAFLLPATVAASNVLVRFVPAADFAGTAALTVRVWDRTQGQPLTTYNTATSAARNLNAFSDNAYAVTQTVAASPAVDYVNSTWAGDAQGQPVTDSFGTHTFGVDAFATIQDGVRYVASGGTTRVDAGTYVGGATADTTDGYTAGIVVDKPVSILGPNTAYDPAGADPAAASQAVVLPGVSDPNPFDAAPSVVFDVTASNVTISGLTIDGTNPSLAHAGTGTAASIDAAEGIVGDRGIGGITVSHNVVRDTAYAGVDFGNYDNGGAATSDNTIAYNAVRALSDAYGYGIGVVVTNNFYARVNHNVLSDVSVGVQTGNFYLADPDAAFAPQIDANAIAASKTGVFYNLHYSAATAFDVSGNAVTAVAEPAGGTTPRQWVGFLVASQQSTVGATFTNNAIDGTGATFATASAGYDFWSDPTAGTLSVYGGTVAGVTYGVWANSFEGYNQAGAATAAVVSNVSITAGTAGVYVEDSPQNPTHPAVSVTVEQSTVRAPTPLLVSGSAASAAFSSDDFQAGTTGINDQGGTLSVGLNNSVTGGTTGLLVGGATAAVAGGTLRNLGFVGQTGNYVTLADGALAVAGVPAELNAAAARFDGVTGSSATVAQAYAIEDKITDAIDEAGVGFARLRSGNVYVTPRSFAAPATDDTGAIARAVGVATDGDTAHVETGNYRETQVVIGKGLTLVGDSQAGVVIDGGGPTVVIPSSSGILKVTGTTATQPVTIQSLTVRNPGTPSDADFFDSPSTIEGISLGGPLSITNVTVVGQNDTSAFDAGIQIVTANANAPITIRGVDVSKASQGLLIEDVLARTELSASHIHDLITIPDGSGGVYAPEGALVLTDSGNVQNSPIVLTGNAVDGYAGYGLIVEAGYGGGTGTGRDANVQITNNVISVAGQGAPDIGIYNSEGSTASGTTSATVSGNTLSGDGSSLADGIDVGGYETGISIAGNTISGTDVGVELYTSSAGGSPAVAVGANTITGTTTAGVEVDGGTATLTGTTISAPVGVLVTAAAASAAVTGTTISNATTGIEDDGGTLTVGAGDQISGGTTGITLSGPTAVVTGNTLNNVVFTGQSGNYVTLANGALSTGADLPLELNATAARFDGVAGSAATLAQAYAIEDKITDYLDVPTVGFVRLKTGDVYVTAKSEATTAGAVQRGVVATANNDTVHVTAGTFVGDVYIPNPLTLQGAQVGVNPTTAAPAASAQTIIKPSTVGGEVVYVGASNVTIDGVTVDGSAAAAAAGTTTAYGSTVAASVGIAGFDGVGGITVRNDVVQHVQTNAVEFYNYTNPAATAGNTIANNLIQFAGGGGTTDGVGVLIYNNFYAAVTGNVIANTRTGIQTGNFYAADPGAAGVISGNTITAARAGLFYNLHYSAATPFTIAGNTVHAFATTESPVTKWDGIELLSQSVGATVSNNTIDGTGTAAGVTSAGYEVWSDSVAPAITGGTVAGVNYGLWVNSYEGYNSTGTAASASIANATLTATTAGVYVEDSAQNSNHPAVSATVTNVTISAPTGVLVTGANASASVVNTSATGGTTGLSVTGGKLLAQGDTLTGNAEGVVVAGGAVADLGDTSNSNTTGLGSSTGGNNLSGYTGVGGNYAVDDRNAVARPNVLAQNDNFGKVSGSDQAFIGTVVHDHADDATLSTVVYTPAANAATQPTVAYVNPAFAGTPLGADPDGSGPATSYGYDAFPDVQDAVAAVAAGGTVRVSAGTFAGPVNVTKNLTLIGSGPTTVLQAAAGMASQFANNGQATAAVLYATGATVNVSNLTVDGNRLGSSYPTGFDGIAYVNAGGTVTGVTVENFEYAPLSGVQSGVGVYDNNTDGAARTFTFANGTVTGYQKNGFVLKGAGLTANVTGTTVTGAGPTAVIAQNGIQVSGSAVGHLSNDTITGNSYTGTAGAVAVGVLLAGSADGTSVAGSTVSGNDIGVYVSGAAGTTTISTTTATGNGTGIVSSDSTVAVAGDDLSGNVDGIDLYGAQNGTSITNTFVQGNTSGPDAQGVGIYVDAGVTDASAPLKINGDNIAGNDTGLYSTGPLTIDATGNYWGSASGPDAFSADGSTQVLNGSGDTAYGDHTTYTPFLTNGTDADNNRADGFQPVAGNLGVDIAGPSTVDEGSTYTLQLDPSSPGNAAVTGYDVNFGDGTAVVHVTGNPSTVTHVYADGPNRYTITATATTTSGPATTNSVAVTVNDVAPTTALTVNSNPGVEGSPISVTATATDPGSVDTAAGFTYHYTVTATHGSTTTTVYDFTTTAEATAPFTFAPTDDGTYVVSVTATDKDGVAGNTATRTLTIANVAPTAALTVNTNPGTEGSAVTLTASATDPSSADTTAGFTYAYSITKTHGTTTTPYGSGSATGATEPISFLPDDDGTYVVTVTATDKDGGVSNVATRTLTIANVAPTATLTVDSNPGTEGAQVTLTATATDPSTADTAANFTYAYTVAKTHGSTTTTYASGSTLAATDPIAFTPDDDGTYVVTVTATDKDGGVSNTATRTLTIANVAPTTAITVNTPAPYAEGSAISATATSTDPSSQDTAAGYTYGYAVTKTHGSVTTTFATGTSSGLTDPITFTPDDDGTYVLSVTATDKDGGVGNTATQSFTVNNVAPSNVTVSATSPEDENGTTTLTGTFTDPGAQDTHTVTVAWGDGSANTVLSLAAGVTSIPATTHQYLDNRPNNAAYTITVTATDPQNASATGTATTVVTNVPPTAALAVNGSGPFVEGSAIGLTATATDPGTVDAAAGYTYAYTVTKTHDSVTTTYATGGTAAGSQSESITFTPDDDGTYVVSVTATDKDGGVSTAATQTITVGNVAPSNVNVSATSPENENGTTTLTGTFTDPGTQDTHTVTIAWGDGSANTVLSLAAGVTTIPATAHQYLDNRPNNAAYTISVTVTDSQNASGTGSTTTVVNNVPPTAALAVTSNPGLEGSAVSLTATATDPGTLDAAAGYTYAYTVTKTHDGVTTTYATGGTAAGSQSESITFTPDDDGTYVVSVTATDKDGGVSAAATQTITVANVAPSNVNVSATSPENENGTTTLTGTFTDPGTQDTHTVSIAWGDGSANTVLTLAAGVTTIPATMHQYLDNRPNNAAYTITVTVTDPQTASATGSTTTVVTNVPPTATLTNVPSTSPEGTAITVTGNAVDPGSLDTLTYAYTVTRNGVAFATGSDGPTLSRTDNFTFTPTSNGTYVVSLVVTDKDGATSAATSQTITVSDVAPTVALSGSKSDPSNPTPNDAEGSTFTLTLGPVMDPGFAGGERVQNYYVNWGDGTPTQVVPASAVDQTTGGTVTHVYADGTVPPGTTSPTTTIHVDILDNNGYHPDAGTLGVVIYDLPPTATFAGSGTVSEGSAGNVLFFNQADPSAPDAAAGYTYSYDFNNDGVFEVANSTSSSASVPASYLSTPGTVTVRGRITDKDGGYTDYTHPITVANVAPTVNALANVNAGAGTAFTETGSFSDPGNDAPWQVYANYNYDPSTNPGLGTLVQTSASKTFTVGTTYATAGTYTVRVTVVDNQGAAGTGTFTVTVAPTGFAVTTFTANPSGFDVTFNRGLNTAALNLYKGLGNTYGTADLTLTGPTGPVRGSFTYDPSTNTGHFVATGGVLPAGTYSASLVGSTSAFQDAAGNPLTSNDGTGNYDATYTIATVGDVVSLPDFARGPGQAVNVPAAATTGLPISIADGTNVTAVDFDVLYNANDLTITGVTLPASLQSAGYSVVTNGSTPGDLRVSIFGVTAMPAGMQTILYLNATVPTAATYGQAAALRIAGLRVNEGAIAGTADEAVEKVAYLGDATGNRGYSGLDASLIANVVVGNATGFDAYPLVDPVVVGDVTGDGTLSGQDASLVAQKSIGLPVSQIPNLPAGNTVTTPGVGLDPVVTIGSLSANPGTTITVPVSISDATGLLGANLAIDFNAAQLQFVSATVGTADGNFTVLSNPNNTAGSVNLALFEAGLPLSGGSGTIAYLTFTVPAAAPYGSNPVTLDTANSNLNEGLLPITPANGAVDIEPAAVGSASVFYNASSKFDPKANPAVGTLADLNAVATDKSPLLPGSTATFANYTSYSLGLNGIVIEFVNLGATTFTAGDFTFHVGNTNTPSTWATAPAPVSVTTLTGANGHLYADIIWANNAIQNQFLQVTVLADADTRLGSAYTFYYGNAIAETGNSTADAKVDATDISLTQLHQTGFTQATITNAYDFNRDGKVDATDIALAQLHQSGFTPLKLIAVPANPSASATPIVVAVPVTARPTWPTPIASGVPVAVSKPVTLVQLTSDGPAVSPSDTATPATRPSAGLAGANANSFVPFTPAPVAAAGPFSGLTIGSPTGLDLDVLVNGLTA